MVRLTTTTLAALLTLGTFVCAADKAPGDQSQDRSATAKVSGNVQLAQRASEITGLTVKNAQGKELGTINDFVLDARKGNVRYLAVSYGGFLGLGDKLFAIPFSAFEWQRDSDDNMFLVLNLPEDKLKNAPGFDQNHWPDFADMKWSQEVDTYYGPTRKPASEVRE